MSRRFQVAPLVASPSYPNAVAWSEENLVAIASGHLVTILNPDTPFGPRGLITLRASKPFPIGVIERKDLLSPCLLPICLSRDIRPCVRSISWSPIGFSPNAGCLLAVCTTEGHVKLYRMPFCEYLAEWIEVVDISERLYTYLATVNFEESGFTSLGIAEDKRSETRLDQNVVVDQPTSVLRKEQKRRRQKALTVVETENENLEENNVRDLIPMPCSEGKSSRIVPESCSLPLITAEQYASRTASLSSLIVVWSPVLRFTFGTEDSFPEKLSGGYSVLAVGGKSGRISFWSICEPECYSTVDSRDLTVASLIGFLQAHDSWITAVSWALFASDASNPQLLLATGSTNGSVKIWEAYGKELVKSSGINQLSFSLLKEVVTPDSSTISVLSLVVPENSLGRVLLAIGKGSGSFEVWSGDLHTSNFEKAGCSNAHQHIVTGLAWAFGGKCLYSCSQDNSIRSWILHENFLSEVPIPSNTPGARSSSDVPNVYDLCFGLAVSPGNLAIAVAHNFDTDLLNPMYQERTQKAAVEFLWIGGQQLDLILNACPEFDYEAFPGLPQKELISWENNILWSFYQYHQHLDKPLALWDCVAALSAFKQSAPDFVQHLLLKWMRSIFGSQFDFFNSTSPVTSKFLSSATSRQLHVLNIISRHVVLKELNANQINGKVHLEGLSDVDEQKKLWLKLLCDSEKELQERLLCFNFSAILKLASYSSTDFSKQRCWTPSGLYQMMQWVTLNMDNIKDHLKLLVAEVGKLERRRLCSICEYIVEEKCSICSAPVALESTEVAFCQGVKNDVGVGQRHKLVRCAVSMQVCPVVASWFCRSCQRRASNLAPPSIFSMPKYPSDIKYVPEFSVPEKSTTPICPFCGILLQRLQPEFLLSPSLV